MTGHSIRIRNAHQNNLRNLDLDLPLGELVVVTGVSGSGKSSLVFDTIYAEGQRRYVETFSPYARQFLDRMDRPRVDRIEGIPPAIAIDQSNPVRTSRSTVGTMSEINDHLKLLFSQAAVLHCRGCGEPVRRDTPQSVAERLLQGHPGEAVAIGFEVRVPDKSSEQEVRQLLASQGYTRVELTGPDKLLVIQDRLKLQAQRSDRLHEALEIALQQGKGVCQVALLDAQRKPIRQLAFSADLHCPDCDIHYRDPLPNHFSFNSPLGACPTCRGFGRVMGVDYDLVIPDPTLSIAEGAIKPFQGGRSQECQDDIMRYGRQRRFPLDTPWQELSAAQRQWAIDGEGPANGKRWYGIRRYFEFLESKSYKMHVRVQLSRYRSYEICPDCQGARLQETPLCYRLGDRALADATLGDQRRFQPAGNPIASAIWQQLPGLNLHDLVSLPIERAHAFVAGLQLAGAQEIATGQLRQEIVNRLDYLCRVGLGYLTLDRQSRTLSGGEVQRINLTTALGTSLVNSLFVLDEPSIGLHPRDIERITGILQQLRDAGNSLLLVEHDPQIMLAADRIIDIGPGPGELGGEILFNGTPSELLHSEHSLTADYLSGRRQLGSSTAIAPPDKQTDWLLLQGARQHNLKNIDLRIPLNRLVCLAGVSGSGKSTLVEDLLYPALCREKGHPDGTPGDFDRLQGSELIEDVVLLDQSPIGKSSRSNPASYVGALDSIRKRFARLPEAKSRGYTAGTFSFNSGNGRCPSCSGTGFEHVEMQFLSDVYLRCPECDGRRYRQEVLEVKLDGLSIAGVLELTVNEAAQFFSGQTDVRRALEPLQAVGLGYLKLGQPVPTLSGGEAQRLKLAGHLAKARPRKDRSKGVLFLFDEPTTGLHFQDIAVLLQAFQRLINRGHSLLVIEHNLDLLASADWLIELGPEGGDRGGEILAEGTPQQLQALPHSHTGRALKRYAEQLQRLRRKPAISAPTHARISTNEIVIRNAREHNLKEISLALPHNRFTVITGVSGSGKSTLAFDIVFAEGQRRYLESLNAYARQFVQPASRPDLDAIHGIPPTVAIEQRTSRGGPKSTVGTLTEIHHFLRLLYVKLGSQNCPECQIPIHPQSRVQIRERILEKHRGERISLLAPLVVNRKGIYKELAAWAARKGYPLLRVDGEACPTHDWPQLDRYQEHNIDLPVGELSVAEENRDTLDRLLRSALDHGKGLVRLVQCDPQGNWGEEQSFSLHRTCPGCGRGFEEPDPRLFSYNSKHGWCTSCYGTGLQLEEFDPEQSGEEGRWISQSTEAETCSECHGGRLNPEALAVRFNELSIAQLSALSVDQALAWLEGLQLDQRERSIGGELVTEVCSRLRFLSQVGLGYLSLDRGAPTLSGGEAQRIRLASQLGSNLQGVCYVLDEPSIGLHPRDNQRLLKSLRALQTKGNTLIVVEHDEETLRQADHLVDLGPGAGSRGGKLVAQGTPQQVMASAGSVTGRFLSHPTQHPLHRRRPARAEHYLEIRGAHSNNLKKLDVRIPLGRLVAVTGVSGSGKSTLVREVLGRNLSRYLGQPKGRRPKPQGCSSIAGWQQLERILEVDQAPIGKTPRSCPATYIGFWDAIRKLYAATPEARIRGWGAGRFSFNTRDGRCPECDGQGMQRIEMSFLPDVTTPCPACNGMRFDNETLQVTYKGLNIGQVLALSVEQAAPLFEAHPAIAHPLQLLQEVGLGYLTLGQQSPTLSGGEAQRIKLVSELAKARPDRQSRTRPTLYLLDEPTVGLHMSDVERLISALHRLVEAGHSIITIEHNLDLVAEADWVIDLGPEGGDAGGELVAQGRPESLVRSSKKSLTGQFLAPLLRRREDP